MEEGGVFGKKKCDPKHEELSLPPTKAPQNKSRLVIHVCLSLKHLYRVPFFGCQFFVAPVLKHQPLIAPIFPTFGGVVVFVDVRCQKVEEVHLLPLLERKKRLG